MNKLLLAALLCASMAVPAMGQTHHDKGGTIIPGQAPIYLYNPATSNSGQMGLSVSSLTSLTVPSGATIAQICVENAAVRYRDDGTAPTATSGMPVSAGVCFQYAGPLSAIQFIGQTGSPTIDVLYYYAN